MMIATLLLLQMQAHPMPPQPRMQCTPALVAVATPEGWGAMGAVADGGRLAIARAATVGLTAGKTFAVAPAKAAAAGAALTVDVPRRGRWRVSLDSGVWVDVVRGGKAVESVAHGHGAPCSGVRKQVEFDLAAGRYGIQLSGDAGARVRVMFSPA